MSNQSCSQCQSSLGHLVCGPCQAPLCKDCAHLLDATHFALSPRSPLVPEHDTFCAECFGAEVQPALEVYDETVARARDINVFYKSQGRETRLIRRTDKLLRVDDCKDRTEALMKLSFLAAAGGFNTLVDVEVEPRKIRNGGWQSSRWSGRAVPTMVDDSQLQRCLVNMNISG